MIGASGARSVAERGSDESSRGLDDERTLVVLRSERHVAWWLLAMAVVLIALFVALLSRANASAAQLRADGARTAGVVRALETNPRFSNITVAYFAGSSRRGRVWLVASLSGACDYRVGQAVTVLYDPTAPARMTVVGERNQGLFSSIVVTVVPVPALILLGYALLLLCSVRRWRRVSATTPWKVFRYRHALVRRRRGHSVVLMVRPLDDPDATSQLIRITGRARRLWGMRHNSTGTLWLAEHGRRVVLATPGPAKLYTGRRPRNDRQRARWNTVFAPRTARRWPR